MPSSWPELHIDQLTVAQRLDLITLLWDSIPDSLQSYPVPEWHLQELDRRLARADLSPESGVPWQQVEDRLRKMP